MSQVRSWATPRQTMMLLRWGPRGCCDPSQVNRCTLHHRYPGSHQSLRHSFQCNSLHIWSSALSIWESRTQASRLTKTQGQRSISCTGSCVSQMLHVCIQGMVTGQSSESPQTECSVTSHPWPPRSHLNDSAGRTWFYRFKSGQTGPSRICPDPFQRGGILNN